MRKNTYTEEELKLIISERKEKIIDNAAINDNYKYYIPINPETGEVTCFSKGIKCILIINSDGEYCSEIENHYYQLVELENRDSVMKQATEVQDTKKRTS